MLLRVGSLRRGVWLGGGTSLLASRALSRKDEIVGMRATDGDGEGAIEVLMMCGSAEE